MHHWKREFPFDVIRRLFITSAEPFLFSCRSCPKEERERNYFRMKLSRSPRIIHRLVLFQGMLYFAHGANIFGFPGSGSSCTGGAYMCKNIGPNKCCNFDHLNVNRIGWKDVGKSSLGIAYTGGKCSKRLSYGCGQNSRCSKTEGATGASWRKGCADSNLSSAAGCEPSVTPNAVSYVYTDGSFHQTLVLEPPTVVDTLTKLNTFATYPDKLELGQGARIATSTVEDGTVLTE